MKLINNILAALILSCSSLSALETVYSYTPEVSILWDDSFAIDKSTVKYIANIGTVSKKYTMQFETPVPETPVSNLVFNTTYYVMVQGYNSSGEASEPSSELAFKIMKITNKYVKVLTSKDGGLTWLDIGEILVPPPIVVGQKYKTQMITK